MGMFDTIIYEILPCKVCGAPLTDYQSKDGDCELQTLTPAQLLAQSDEKVPVFYAYCHDDDWNNRKLPHHYNGFKVFEVTNTVDTPKHDVEVLRDLQSDELEQPQPNQNGEGA